MNMKHPHCTRRLSSFALFFLSFVLLSSCTQSASAKASNKNAHSGSSTATARPTSGVEEHGPSANVVAIASAAAAAAAASSSNTNTPHDTLSLSSAHLESGKQIIGEAPSTVQQGVTNGEAGGQAAAAGEEGAAPAVVSKVNITEKTPEQVLQSYLSRFLVKRAQQLSTTEEILRKSEYEHRYQLSKALVDEMFRSLRKAQRVLEQVENISAMPPIPVHNDTLLTAALATWENTPFLADLILRLPDMLHLQIDDHAVRKEVLAWALRTCLASPVFADDDAISTPLRLAQQEMELVPRDPDYVNPYRGVDDAVPAVPQRTRRTRLPRGPKLSRAEL